MNESRSTIEICVLQRQPLVYGAGIAFPNIGYGAGAAIAVPPDRTITGIRLTGT